MKVKVSWLNEADLEKIKQRNIDRLRRLYAGGKWVTLDHLAEKTRMPISFIYKNWEQIIK